MNSTTITLSDTGYLKKDDWIAVGDGSWFRVVAVKDNTITVRALYWYEKSLGIVIIIAVLMGLISAGIYFLTR